MIDFPNGPHSSPKSQIGIRMLRLEETQETEGFKRLLFEWLHVVWIITDM